MKEFYEGLRQALQTEEGKALATQLIISKGNPTGENLKISPLELKRIRALEDFDLVMFLSEIEDLGWKEAKALLPLIEEYRGL